MSRKLVIFQDSSNNFHLTRKEGSANASVVSGDFDLYSLVVLEGKSGTGEYSYSVQGTVFVTSFNYICKADNSYHTMTRSTYKTLVDGSYVTAYKWVDSTSTIGSGYNKILKGTYKNMIVNITSSGTVELDGYIYNRLISANA